MQTPAASGGLIVLESVLISSLNALQLPLRGHLVELTMYVATPRICNEIITQTQLNFW